MISRLLKWVVGMLLLSTSMATAADEGMDAKVDAVLQPIAKWFDEIIFTPVTLFGEDVPIVLLLLAFTAIFLTLYFKFINLRSIGLAIRTVKGKYSSKDDPGQITHFQALSTAVSATVGLGNIAGVAIAISLGGPGAVFWMIFMGFMGMTSKFTECTLGVKYRMIDAKGKARGGGMYYLRDGLAEKGLGGLGKVLAVIFAIACIGGAIGAGNMFQVNQAHQQVSETFNIFNGDNGGWTFGLMMAVFTGLVIIGGIVSIARVTGVMVPFMCISYIIACLVVLSAHITEIPAAIGTIITSAFTGEAALGGVIISLIQGVKRGVFSNEAGVGSAAMAHAAVKTKKPASEGIVALLEPFIDTVVVCSMTALVIVVTGMWKVNSDVKDESLALLQSPIVGAVEVSTFEKGVHLKVQSKWRKVPSGWVKADAIKEERNKKGFYSSSKPVKVYSAPAVKDLKPVEEAVKNVEAGPIWAYTSDPKTESIGWVPFESLNDRSDTSGGIWLTSQAFSTVISWFPYVLAIAVFLFAFSTLISWSYYGEQAVDYLFKGNAVANAAYKLIFCLFIVLGSAASLGSVLLLSDAMFFAMVVPNLIGLYFLLPIVKKELKIFREHTAEIDAKQG